MAPEDCTTFHADDEEAPLAGLGGMMDAHAGTPSHRLVHLAVADADASVAAARSDGETVVSEPWDTPFGRMVPSPTRVGPCSSWPSSCRHPADGPALTPPRMRSVGLRQQLDVGRSS